jgi:hypothetical protein
MTKTAFRASSERLADETRTIRVVGELDLYTAIESALNGAVR